jgi:hypothetical protein
VQGLPYSALRGHFRGTTRLNAQKLDDTNEAVPSIEDDESSEDKRSEYENITEGITEPSTYSLCTKKEKRLQVTFYDSQDDKAATSILKVICLFVVNTTSSVYSIRILCDGQGSGLMTNDG